MGEVTHLCQTSRGKSLILLKMLGSSWQAVYFCTFRNVWLSLRALATTMAMDICVLCRYSHKVFGLMYIYEVQQGLTTFTNYHWLSCNAISWKSQITKSEIQIRTLFISYSYIHIYYATNSNKCWFGATTKSVTVLCPYSWTQGKIHKGH